MPRRKYNLGKRAAGVAATRQRIVEAAASLYAEKGIPNTTMQDVAHKADVSPATVLNHFAKPDSLVNAVIAHWLELLRPPTLDALGDARALQTRLTRLARELAAFYARSEPLYRVLLRDRERVKALSRAETRFMKDLARLFQDALAPFKADPRTRAGVMAAMSPAVFGQLQAHGMSAAEAGDLVAEMLTPWVKGAFKRAR